MTTTFALVHGAYHSGAHWAPLVPSLRSLGHEAVAPDLPSADPSAGAAEYAAVVHSALGDADNVIVVGHSLGGLTAPLLPSLRTVSHIVYLCALLPCPGKTFDDYLGTEPDIFVREPIAPPTAHDDGSVSSHPAHAGEMYFHDLDWQTARWACGLLRPQQWKITHETCPLSEMPAVPSSSIVAREDRQINPEWSRRTARERLGVEAIEVDGGHSPMLRNPEGLASILDQIARTPSL